jgi:hypothetical protein
MQEIICGASGGMLGCFKQIESTLHAQTVVKNIG